MDGGLVLRVAVRRLVAEAGRGVAGVDDGVKSSGGRSSGTYGFGVVVHGRRSRWVKCAPRGALSAVTRSVWTEAYQDDGGDKSGAGEASVSTETRATMSKWARE